MITGIHGINIAVKNLATAIECYENLLGVQSTPLNEEDFAFPHLSGAQLNINGFRINLIATSNADNSVGKFLDRNGEGVFLVSIGVNQIDEDINSLREKGIKIILDNPVTGTFGAVNFIHPKSMNGVQFEIYQPGGEP